MGQERGIIKYGLVNLTDDERASYKLQILASVVTPNKTAYYNEKSNPPKGFFGYATIHCGSYVQSIVPIEFRNQVIYSWTNSDIQLEALMACAVRSINLSLINFASAHIPPIVLGETTPLTISLDACPVSSIKFKLLDDVRLTVRVSTIDIQRCNDQDAPASVSEPSEPPPPLESTQPFSHTPPYDETNNDNGDTYWPEKPPGTVGGWDLVFAQLDCSGQPYPNAPFRVIARRDEAPYLSTDNPDGPTGTGICCGQPAPRVYLLGGSPPRNLLGPNQNINTVCGNFRIISAEYTYK